MTALLLPMMIGVAALATEYGQALAVQTANQRVADLASYAGALAYGKANDETVMRAAALNIAALHGVEAKTVSVSLVSSPRTAGAKAVDVSIVSSQPIYLAKLLKATDLTIASSALAEVGVASQSVGCVVALDAAGTGITLSGGTTLDAGKCAINSNATITSPCGTRIVTETASYNSAAAPDQPSWCKTIVTSNGAPAPLTKAVTADPLAGDATIKAASARFAEIRKYANPSAPSAANSEKDIKFESTFGSTDLTKDLAGQGCTAVYTSLWTVTCTRKTISFGKFSVGGGLTVEFNLNGLPDTTYTFISIEGAGGGKFRFGRGTFNVAKGIVSSGGEGSFGAGTFRVGASQSPTCDFSVCGSSYGTLTFAGPSRFELSSGLQVSGSNATSLGEGATNNIYAIGAGKTGQTISVGGGATAILGDATGSTDSFRAFGRIETGGGSCLVLPAAAHHDIVGSIDASGALKLGAGVYTIDGFLGLGQSGGGSSQCQGKQISLYAKDVTIVLSGRETGTGWSCTGAVFCAGGGFNNMVLTSPMTGPYAQLAVIGPLSKPGSAVWSGGASGGQIGGAFYFPTGAISMSGGASAAGTQANCFSIIAKAVTLSGGTAGASACEGLKGSGGGGGGGAIRVVG